jgi:hypothetical protein
MNGYLKYEANGPYVGILHWLSNLKAIIMEAIYLNRIPIITPPLLHPQHNLGIKLNSPWSKYLNLSQTEVYFRNNEEFELMQKPFMFILDEDFKNLNFGEDQVYKIGHEHEITDAENNNYELIVRSVDGVKMGWWLRAVPVKIKKNTRINLKVSDDVLRISKNIIERLGWYAAVHVRRGDRLKRNKNLKKFTSPQHIFKTLRDIVPLKANVYILTDERDRNYFNYLREHYKIYQYFDFDELNVIVSGKEPDNNFLFLIEQRIFENAAKKIETFKWRSYFSESSEMSSLSKYTWNDYTITYRLLKYYLSRYYLSRKIPFIWKGLHRLKIKFLNIVNLGIKK